VQCEWHKKYSAFLQISVDIKQNYIYNINRIMFIEYNKL
jgi:hypothetical protein